MSKFLLEVCADSVESVLAAKEGGADRIELCADLIIGGTTPSPSLFRQVRKHTHLPIHVMIRPRFGDFCYTREEFAVMLDQVNEFRHLGAQGVVFGILLPDGSLDLPRMLLLKQAAGPLSVTLHRAFDLCRDPLLALEQSIEMGLDTILTSGQQDSCLSGAPLLTRLQQKSAGRITIMAGAGVDAAAIRTLYPKTGIAAWHMSGKVTLDSPMEYRNPSVHMGLPLCSEYTLTRTDATRVQSARQVLDTIKKEVTP